MRTEGRDSLNPETANAVALERLFKQPLVYLGFAIESALVAGVLGATAPQAVATASLVWGIQQALRLGNFAGRAGVVREAYAAVESGQASPEIQPGAPIGEPVSQPITIAVPKPKPPVPPYAPPSLGKIPYFEEAAQDIISREPVVIQDALMRTAGEVGQLYKEKHAFALAKSASETVTRKVQSIVEEGITQGLSVDQAVAKIREVKGDWTRAYAETVYRTNLATAQTEGRFQQASRPGMDKILPTMVFQTVGDGRVRPNHAACSGASAPPGHALWDRIRPPLGYNCRCRVNLISWEMARRMGLVDQNGTVEIRLPKSGGGPDPGFVHSGRSRWA